MLNDDLPPALRGPIRARLRGAPGQVTPRWDARHDMMVLVAVGRVSFHDLVAGIEVSLELGCAARMLWNVVEADLSGIPRAKLRMVVDHAFSGPWAPRRLAVLAGEGPSLAIASLLVLAAEERNVGERVEVFAHRDPALEWLGVRERPTTPSTPNAGRASRHG